MQIASSEVRTSIGQRLDNLVRVQWIQAIRRATRPTPRPDFTDEPMELVQAYISDINATGGEHVGKVEWLPLFTNYTPDIAIKNGWVRNVRDYQTFGALVFAYRYPNHPLSQEVRSLQPGITDAAIVRMMRGA